MYNLLTLTILLNIVFLRETLAQHNHRLPSRKLFSTRVPRFETSTEDVSFHLVPEIITEYPDIYQQTTEHIIDTTTKDDVHNCPYPQSFFSKPDLMLIMNNLADQRLHILANIINSYNDTAIHARDELLQELSEFETKLKNSPGHLNHILEDMEDTRLTKIAPLVKIAAATLQEYPVVEGDFNRLYNKTMEMINYLNKSKLICELNNCNQSLRNFSSLRSLRNLITKKQEDDEHMCSTLDNVQKIVQERLLSFEQNEIETLKQYITDHNESLKEAVANLKQRLRDAAITQFGITMYDVLSLGDEHYHFMKTLINFTSQSYTSALKKQNMNIEYLLMDLHTKSQDYRRHCLNCGQALLRQRRQVMNEMDVEPKTDTDKEETNILDNIIDAKILEIRKAVNLNIDNIFKYLNDIVNDKEYVEKMIYELKPVQESVNNRTKQEKQALESLMDTVPRKSIERVQVVYEKSAKLIKSIHDALNFFDKK